MIVLNRCPAESQSIDPVSIDFDRIQNTQIYAGSAESISPKDKAEKNNELKIPINLRADTINSDQ